MCVYRHCIHMYFGILLYKNWKWNEMKQKHSIFRASFRQCNMCPQVMYHSLFIFVVCPCSTPPTLCPLRIKPHIHIHRQIPFLIHRADRFGICFHFHFHFHLGDFCSVYFVYELQALNQIIFLMQPHKSFAKSFSFM